MLTDRIVPWGKTSLMLQCQDIGLCVHAWVCACMGVCMQAHVFCDSLVHSNHAWQKGSEILKCLKLWGEMDNKAGEPHSISALGEGKATGTSWLHHRRPTSQKPWTEQKETRLCWLRGLLLSLQRHGAFIAPGTWTILIKGGKVWRSRPAPALTG